jgi:hypothetical protein
MKSLCELDWYVVFIYQISEESQPSNRPRQQYLNTRRIVTGLWLLLDRLSSCFIELIQVNEEILL